jgi:hypothetical protein
MIPTGPIVLIIGGILNTWYPFPKLSLHPEKVMNREFWELCPVQTRMM